MNLSESYKRRLQELAGVDNSTIAYHGTNKGFDKFDVSFAGESNDPGDYGEGIYFDTNKGWAAAYSNKEIGTIIKVKINLTNPYIVDFPSYSEFNNKKSRGEIDRLQIPEELKEYIGVLNTGGANIDIENLITQTNGTLTFLSISRKLGSKNITKFMVNAGHDGIIVNYGKSKEIVVYDIGRIEILKKEPTKTFYQTADTNESLNIIKEAEERKLGKSLSSQMNTPFVIIYRAAPNDVFEFRNMDYVTLSKKFAIEHSESNHVYHEEPFHVIQALVSTNNVFDAYNPGEYFYSGQPKKAKEIYVSKGDDYEGLDENEYPEMKDMISKYKLRYPKGDTFIVVNINKLLARHKKDTPDLAFDSKETSDHPARVDKAKQFWQDYSNDQRYMDFKTKERTNWGNMEFEAPYVGIYNGKLGFSDGRHRVISMKELGYEDIVVEIPKKQIKLFDELK